MLRSETDQSHDPRLSAARRIYVALINQYRSSKEHINASFSSVLWCGTQPPPHYNSLRFRRVPPELVTEHKEHGPAATGSYRCADMCSHIRMNIRGSPIFRSINGLSTGWSALFSLLLAIVVTIQKSHSASL